MTTSTTETPSVDRAVVAVAAASGLLFGAAAFVRSAALRVWGRLTPDEQTPSPSVQGISYPDGPTPDVPALTLNPDDAAHL